MGNQKQRIQRCYLRFALWQTTETLPHYEHTKPVKCPVMPKSARHNAARASRLFQAGISIDGGFETHFNIQGLIFG